MPYRILLLLLSALFLTGCRERSTPALPVYTVQAEHPQWGEVTAYREWIGELKGGVSAEIEPLVSGYVAEKLFGTGESVSKGQVLYRIDSTRYVQALERAEQQQAQAQANYDEARQNTAYYRPLVPSGSISRQTYTDAVQRENAAAAALQAARANADLARTEVGYCTLRSPIDGICGFASADVGSYVSPDGAPLVLINSMNPISIHFSISERDWLEQGGMNGPLHNGAPLQLIPADGRVYPHTAVVTGVDNTVNTATGTIMLDASVPNPDDLLRPGMYVRVRAQVDAPQKALLVPQSALVSIQGRDMLVKADTRGGASLIPVTTGLSKGDMIAVSGAISPADLIITKGTQQGVMAAEQRAVLRVTETAQ